MEKYLFLVFQEILAGLSLRGHKVVKLDAFQSVVVGVQVEEEDGTLLANNDFRKAGAVDGFWTNDAIITNYLSLVKKFESELFKTDMKRKSLLSSSD